MQTYRVTIEGKTYEVAARSGTQAKIAARQLHEYEKRKENNSA